MKFQRHLLAFFVGLLFATGLAISQMTVPARVIGFLDFFGEWDPTLLGVMGGGVIVYFALFRTATNQPAPVFSDVFQIPDRTDITGRLVVGSAMFGVGWGLAGYCPGPALTALPTGLFDVLIFSVAMIGGMLLFRGYDGLISSMRENREAAALQTDG
jgi:uncharacterized membrane protein YedE/YeeE